MDPLVKKYQLVHEAFSPLAAKLGDVVDAWDQGDGSVLENSPEELKLLFLKQMEDVVSVEETEKGLIVKGYVDLGYKNLKSIPWKFYKIIGNFVISGNPITSLKNCPLEVHGDLGCTGTSIFTLAHAPRYVGGNAFFQVNPNLLPLRRPDDLKKGEYIAIENEFWSDEEVDDDISDWLDADDYRVDN